MRNPFGSGASVARLGIAVGAGRLVAATSARGLTHVAAVDVPGGVAAADVARLTTAFGDLRARLAAAAGRDLGDAEAAIALLPPFVETKLLKLPPLRPGEAVGVVARDPRRYFLGGGWGATPVIATGDRARGSAAPLLASIANAASVESALAAARAAGWRVVRVVPAHAAWAAAARHLGADSIAAFVEGMSHAITLDPGGAPAAIRRFAPGDSGAADEPTPPGLLLNGVAPIVPAAGTAALASAGTSAATPGRVVSPTADPAALAALHAGVAEPEFVTGTIAAERSSRGRRSLARLAAAAVLFVAASGALELWGARRELDAIAARRRELGPGMPALLALRDSLLAIEARRAAIRELSASAGFVTPALLDVALELPVDSHLTSLRTRGDSLTIEAVGGGAARAITALSAAGALAEVRLRGAVAREILDGGRPIERYTIDARIISGNSPVVGAVDPETLCPPGTAAAGTCAEEPRR